MLKLDSKKLRVIVNLCMLAIVFLALSLPISANLKQASASPGLFSWTAVDTPSSQYNVVVSPSEINNIALAPDGLTAYAVDIPDTNSSGGLGRLYRSRDGGATWFDELSQILIAAGAFTPIWMVAVAPDDSNFIVAVTDGVGGLLPGGPKQLYFSSNGGATWQQTNFIAPAGEWISCVDISYSYAGVSRDVAVGTRTGAGTGKVYTAKYAAIVGSGWIAQDGAGSSWQTGDVIALKFSTTYASDFTLAVVSSDGLGTWLQLGSHDTENNFTTWNALGGYINYPVLLVDPAYVPASPSPTFTQIVTGQIQLPSDFSGTTDTLRRIFICTDAMSIAGVQAGVYRVDNSVVYRINPPTGGRISSISYYGTYTNGILLVGEVTADPASAMATVWRSIDCTCATPGWVKSDAYKSPTGGGNSGYANAQVAWAPDGTRAYCGTSSACLGTFTTPDGTIDCTVASEWPDGYLNSVARDESAFSISPYAPAYGALLLAAGKEMDATIGNIWNQLSLIDTEMDYLTDVAALQTPRSAGLETVDYDILYLSSNSENLTITYRFNSIWRSTSSILGRTWERVLCSASDNIDAPILRVKQTSYEEQVRSMVVVFANLNKNIAGYSANEGQLWEIRPFTNIIDLALSNDSTMYILNDILIYRFTREENGGWILTHNVDSELSSGHTIAVPLTNPDKTLGGKADMVVVGEGGPPLGLGRIIYADFSESIVSGGPPIMERLPTPVIGEAHVIFDDKFASNGIIYNAISIPGGGKIYRWYIGESTTWDEIEPPNAEFYGLVQRSDVLYGAWKTPQVPEIIVNNAGVDRTLYPRAKVPPPPEWDYLVAQLPVAVIFDREPTSLKISSNDFNTLWAIDDRQYDFAAIVGRLWTYEDPASKVGPFTTAPPSGSSIPVDPRSGRAIEINFSWRQLSYATVYEIQIAKDPDFYNRVLVNENVVPADQQAPTVYTPAGALLPASGSNIGSWGNLEAGHMYYWRVRSRAAITGEKVRSPWSATMYFTVEAGLPTASPYPTMVLFNPTYGSKNVSTTPGFSWSSMQGITKYEFVLARDPAMLQIVVKTEVPLTSYLYDGTLENGKTYYWQVRAIEPVVSDPSPVGSFTVIAAAKPATPVTGPAAPIPVWVWGVIAAVASVIISLILFATLGGASYSRPSGGKLFKVEPIADKAKEATSDKPVVSILKKAKNSLSKIWQSIVLAIKRVRILKKRKDSQPDDNQSKST
ncbi:MAG TPA: hypothetical protein VF366_00270 [Dehalococcoidia bacterium]